MANAKQQTAHNRTLAALPLPSEEMLTLRRVKAAERAEAETYQIRLATFKRSLANRHITIETVREMWLEWYGQYWDDVAGDTDSEPGTAAAAQVGQ